MALATGGRDKVGASKDLDRYLLDGERLVANVHQHWGIVARPVGAAIGGLVVALFLDATVPRSIGQVTSIVWWIWFAVFAYAIWVVANWRNDWFVATDKRLLLFHGIVTRRVSMMPLIKVTDMSYMRTVPGKMFGYGRFIMESAGQDQALSEINFVPQPDHYYRAICAEIFGVDDAHRSKAQKPDGGYGGHHYPQSGPPPTGGPPGGVVPPVPPLGSQSEYEQAQPAENQSVAIRLRTPIERPEPKRGLMRSRPKRPRQARVGRDRPFDVDADAGQLFVPKPRSAPDRDPDDREPEPGEYDEPETFPPFPAVPSSQEPKVGRAAKGDVYDHTEDDDFDSSGSTADPWRDDVLGDDATYRGPDRRRESGKIDTGPIPLKPEDDERD